MLMLTLMVDAHLRRAPHTKWKLPASFTRQLGSWIAKPTTDMILLAPRDHGMQHTTFCIPWSQTLSGVLIAH